MLRPFECFENGRMNGFGTFIMQSDENKNKILEEAEENVYKMGIDREDAFEMALDEYNLSLEKDFTDPDKKEIINWVNGSGLIF